jgi:hypothetical protein
MMKRHQWAVGASGLDRPLRMQWCCGRGGSVSLQRLDVYEEGCAREQKSCMSRKAVAITCAATVSHVSVQDDVDGSRAIPSSHSSESSMYDPHHFYRFAT